MAANTIFTTIRTKLKDVLRFGGIFNHLIATEETFCKGWRYIYTILISITK